MLVEQMWRERTIWEFDWGGPPKGHPGCTTTYIIIYLAMIRPAMEN